MNFKHRLLSAALIGGSATMFLALPAHAAGSAEGTRQSVGEYAGDAVTTTKVKAALLKAHGNRSLSISVKTEEGVVILSGTADDTALMDDAVRTARAVEGVRDVRNELQLKPQGKQQ